MFQINQLIGFGARSPLCQLEFLDSAFTNSDTSSPSFAALNFGAAADDRELFALVIGRDQQAGYPQATACTIGGQTASFSGTRAGSSAILAEIWHAVVAAGTSGTVSFNLTATCENTAVFLYGVTGRGKNLGAGENAYFNDNNSGDTTSHDTTLDIPKGGFAIVGCYWNNDIEGTPATPLVQGATQSVEDSQKRQGLYVPPRRNAEYATNYSMTHPSGSGGVFSWVFDGKG